MEQALEQAAQIGRKPSPLAADGLPVGWSDDESDDATEQTTRLLAVPGALEALNATYTPKG